MGVAKAIKGKIFERHLVFFCGLSLCIKWAFQVYIFDLWAHQ